MTFKEESVLKRKSGSINTNAQPPLNGIPKTPAQGSTAHSQWLQSSPFQVQNKQSGGPQPSYSRHLNKGILKKPYTTSNLTEHPDPAPRPNLLEHSLSARLRLTSSSVKPRLTKRDDVQKNIVFKQFNKQLSAPPPLSRREELRLKSMEETLNRATVINRKTHENILREKMYDSPPYWADDGNIHGFGQMNGESVKPPAFEEQKSEDDKESADIQETCQHPIAFLLPGDTTGMGKVEWKEYLRHIQALRDAERKSMKRRYDSLVKSYVDLDKSSFHSNVFHERKIHFRQIQSSDMESEAAEQPVVKPITRMSLSAPQPHKVVRIIPPKSSTAPSPLRHSLLREWTGVSWERQQTQSRSDPSRRLWSKDLHPVATGLRRQGTASEQVRFNVLNKPGDMHVTKVWNSDLKPTDNPTVWLNKACIF